MTDRKIRVVAAVPGLDCHDKGLRNLAIQLGKAGMEVIYLGRFRTPEQIVKTAIDEDADVIALSYLQDPFYTIYFPKIAELLREQNASNICVVAGGRISDDDKPMLEKIGITGHFTQHAPMQEIIDHITQRVENERWKSN